MDETKRKLITAILVSEFLLLIVLAFSVAGLINSYSIRIFNWIILFGFAGAVYFLHRQKRTGTPADLSKATGKKRIIFFAFFLVSYLLVSGTLPGKVDRRIISYLQQFLMMSMVITGTYFLDFRRG